MHGDNLLPELISRSAVQPSTHATARSRSGALPPLRLSGPNDNARRPAHAEVGAESEEPWSRGRSATAPGSARFDFPRPFSNANTSTPTAIPNSTLTAIFTLNKMLLKAAKLNRPAARYLMT